ncbi:MAG: hypothetical protein AAF376_18580 [Pseudomonadota bacterium]
MKIVENTPKRLLIEIFDFHAYILNFGLIGVGMALMVFNVHAWSWAIPAGIALFGFGVFLARRDRTRFVEFDRDAARVSLGVRYANGPLRRRDTVPLADILWCRIDVKVSYSMDLLAQLFAIAASARLILHLRGQQQKEI